MSLPETFKALTPAENYGEKPQFKDFPLQKPGKNQVLIKIAYAAVHPYDLMLMSGAMKLPGGSAQIVGHEGSGTIVAVGEELNYPFKVGDKVHATGDGTFAEYYLAPTEKVYPIKGNLSMEEASNHFGNPATVYYIGVMAQRGGHKTIVHTLGASAIGKMLIKYCKHIGIKLINIVRSQENVEELKKLGADFVLNSSDPDFEKQLKELAEKENATMAMEGVGGEFTNKVFRAMPSHSVTYIYGTMSKDKSIKDIEIQEFFRSKGLVGFTLFDYIAEMKQKGEFRKFVEEVHSLLPTVFKTDIVKIFPLEKLDEAAEFYQKNSSKGKILLKPN